MKKMIALILCCVLLVALVPDVFAVDVFEPDEAYIWIDFWGTMNAQHVLVDDNTIYVPIKMLSRFGGMVCHEGDSQYTFYYSGEADNKLYAKRIIIDKSGKSAQHVVYTSKTDYLTISSVKFSHSYKHNGSLYFPLAEFLPLIDAKTEIDNEGIVHIYTNAVPFFSALYGVNLDLLNFDANEDIFAADLVCASGMILDSILGIKVDRLDFIANSGKITDYKKIFKSLLTDDDIFLSAYDQENTPFQKNVSTINNALKDVKGKIGEVKNASGFMKYVCNSDAHDAFNDFSKGVSEFNSIIEKSGKVAEGVYKCVDYYSAYINQVDDHRKMLGAVYGGEYFDGYDPVCIAADETETLYGSNFATRLSSAASSALRDYVSKEATKLATSGINLAPYKIAFTATKVILPEMAETFSDSARIMYYDRIVADASDSYFAHSADLKVDEESLNDLRLSLMLALLTSRKAYMTYWDDEYDLVKPISERMEKLYLASESLTCVSKGYYEEKYQELAKKMSLIETVEYSGGDGSELPDYPGDIDSGGSTGVTESGSIAAGGLSVILLDDGTVVSKGWRESGYDVSGWRNVVAVSTDDIYYFGTDGHTVGLKKDGTVLATGENSAGQCEVSSWTDIIAVSAGNGYTVGLKSDGTVVAVGETNYGKCNVAGWTDIIAISTGGEITAGLNSNGTVVATGGSLLDVSEVADWSNITAIAVGDDFIIGLKKNGTVISAGQSISREVNGIWYDPCGVRGWTDIVAVSAGPHHTVGLKSDGTVVAVGLNDYGQCKVSDWTDIVEIAAGECHTIGKKSDGSLVAVGYNEYGQCNLANIGKPDTPDDGGVSDTLPSFDPSKLKIDSAFWEEGPEGVGECFWSAHFTSTVNYGNQNVTEHLREQECSAIVSMSRVNAASSIMLDSIYKEYQKNVSGNAMTPEKWNKTYSNYDIIGASAIIECGPKQEGYLLYGGQFRLGLLDLKTGKTFMVTENEQYIHSTLNGSEDAYLIASASQGTMTMYPGMPETNYVSVLVYFLVPAGYDELALYVGYSDPKIEDELSDMEQSVGFYYDTPGCKEETLFVELP